MTLQRPKQYNLDQIMASPMQKSVSTSPRYSIIFVSDPWSSITVPKTGGEKLVSFTETCISIGTLAESDGETSISLGDEAEQSGLIRVFSGEILTPSGSISVTDALGEKLIVHKVGRFNTHVDIYTNDDSEPSRIAIVTREGT